MLKELRREIHEVSFDGTHFTFFADTNQNNIVSRDLLYAISRQFVYFNDLQSFHWSFDFKFKDYWIENIYWNATLNECQFIIH